MDHAVASLKPTACGRKTPRVRSRASRATMTAMVTVQPSAVTSSMGGVPSGASVWREVPARFPVPAGNILKDRRASRPGPLRRASWSGVRSGPHAPVVADQVPAADARVDVGDGHVGLLQTTWNE